MKNPFANLFPGWNVVTGSDKDNAKNIRPYKVKKAVDFLSLPEIQNIDAFNTKVKFLKTRGLSEDEINEAFGVVEKYAQTRVGLHEIASDIVPDANETNSITLHRNETNSFSSIFSFCHKLLMVAGIVTSCYYLYKQWLTIKTKLEKSKKEDAVIKADLRQIKLDLLRIAKDLKQYEMIQENQTKLLAEVNSLKAILTSRQYFEEKKNAKLTMPSWQLSNSSHSDSTSSNATMKEHPSASDVQSNQTNGHVDGIEPTAIPRKLKSNSITPADAVVVSKLTDPKQETVVTNGASPTENEVACSSAGDPLTKSSSEKRRDAKKSDRKQNSKN